MSNYKFETLQVHAGNTPDPTTGASATPIYQSASFAFKNVEEGRKIFAHEKDGFSYSRIVNPTVDTFTKRIAALEGGYDAVAAASGIAAQWLVMQGLCKAGDNLISSISLYGGTYGQFKNTLPQFGVNVKFCSCNDRNEVESLIDDKTKGIYVETIANSNLAVPDFEMLAQVAAKHNIPLIVDNTVGCGGYLCRPLEKGANIVTHSATKWICGHGNTIGGVVVNGGNFDWSCGKFPKFTEAQSALGGKSYLQRYGKGAFSAQLAYEGLTNFGGCLSPFNAFLLLMGVETLSLRVQRVCDNALALAKWLEKNPKIAKVCYPGLESHPTHKNAVKYLNNGFGGIIFVDLKASKEQTARVVERFKLFTLLANLGDNKSLVTHPATSTHSELSEAELNKVGITGGTLRLCIGIENIEDIIADFDNALRII
jgi:O-acetylhomoserine (thiol)-lyase